MKQVRILNASTKFIDLDIVYHLPETNLLTESVEFWLIFLDFNLVITIVFFFFDSFICLFCLPLCYQLVDKNGHVRASTKTTG